ncbi:hypothetical protein TWF718_011066 [Orbilia javanica]|uniref:BTB domain-containing protein n=1 Tax=Orbilia javanica TaxID=47235 RepID=A0AAN8MVD3_9PEZI
MASGESTRAFEKSPLYLYDDPDYTIVFEDEEIKVHGRVIGPQSDFFKALIRSQLKESQTKFIPLPEMELQHVVVALNWMYRVPLEPHNLFSQGAAKELQGILETFRFLQIKDAAGEYFKSIDKSLRGIGGKTGHMSSTNIDSIIIQVNEIYRAGGSVTKKALDRMVQSVYRGSLSTRFAGVLENLPDPDVRCFRDIMLAVMRVR